MFRFVKSIFVLIVVVTMLAVVPVTLGKQNQQTERLVVLAGTVQGALGGANWTPSDQVTKLTYLGNGLYQFIGIFPKGVYEYKIAINGSWDENYGKEGSSDIGVRNGPNITLAIPENNFQVRFTFDDNSKTIKDSVNDDIKPYETPSKVAVIGLPQEIVLHDVGNNLYTATMVITKGVYSYQVQYNNSADLIFGAKGIKKGAGIGLSVITDNAVTFVHNLGNNVTFDSLNYVEIPADKQPTLVATDIMALTLQDEDKDNIYQGTLNLPAGKKSYSFQVKLGSEVVDTATINFNEITANYPVLFQYNHVTKKLSHDYIEQLAGLDGKVVGKSLYYNSRDLQYKTPFGAVPENSVVSFTFSAKAHDLEKVNLVVATQKITGNQDAEVYLNIQKYPLTKMGLSADGSRELWNKSLKFEGKNVYGYYFEAIDGTTTAVYGNNSQVIPVPHTRVIGTGGVGYYYEKTDELIQYKQTVYDPSFKTPDWAKDVIYYYVFPERFRNGDSANDPKPGVTLFYNRKPIEFHTHWADKKPWTPGDGDGNTTDDGEWSNDFYGGDLNGVIEKLDYLKDLGINTLYFNPIFEAPSNHKYDTADYMNVDDNFGGNAAFTQLINMAKQKGIRVILDASLNHSGSDSVYMDRYSKYPTLGAFENETIRTDSPYYNWYEFNPNATNPDQMYNQWGNPTLANLKESDSYKNFAFRNPDSVTKYWLGQGASGWRMDVAPWVSDDFWREWRTELKKSDPNALTVAETWFDSSKYFLGDMFDSTMNYIFRQAVFDYANGESAENTANALEMMRENYPPEAFNSLMNLLSTHDAQRALYTYGYKDNGESAAVVAAAKQKLLFSVLIQMTYPGAPTVFYGDEVGMTGGDDPYNRGPYPWKDKGGNPDETLLTQFKQLIKMRNDYAVLRRGSIEMLYTDNNVMAILREYQGQKAIVVTNNATTTKTIQLDLSGKNVIGSLTDLLSGGIITVTNNKLTIDVPATFGKVLVKKSETACVPNPFPGVDLYLKGTFSGWSATEAYKFTYQCNKYQLMTELKGAHEFKVADPNWTLASTFGAVKGASQTEQAMQLETPKTLVTGEMYPNLTFTGSGYYTFTLDVSQSITQPVFTITENKSCVANPFPNVPLYLKGTFSGWSADEQYKFTYRCNAFILGANLEGKHEFKVADADWTLNSTFGAAKEASEAEREIKLDTPKILVTGEMYPNLVFSGTGYYTFTLDVSQSFTQPTFTVNKNYACATNPFTRPLYLRGDFNGWGAEKAYLFSYKCNAFEVTANVKGKNGFKIADANWTNGTNFGAAPDSNDSTAVVTINTPKLLSEGGSTKNLVFTGTAAHKFTLDIANSITQPTLTVGPETAPIGPTDLDRIVSVEDFLTNKTWQPLTNVVSYKQEGNTITFSLENTKTVKLYLLTPSMFRVRFNRTGNYTFEDSYAVIKTDFGAVDYKVTEQNGKIIVTTADLKIEVNKTPFAVSVYKGNVLINADTQGMALLDSRVINFKKLISGTKIYGLGEKTGSVKKNGASLKMWNTDAYGYTEGSDPLYVSIPFFMETNKDYSSGTFFDNSYQTYFNMGQRKADEYYFGALNGELNYYFMSGNNVKDVLAQYTALTGRIPMPPRWALGYQQSRYSYKTEAEVDNVANTLRQKKMPADVIYLDIDFLEGNKAFTWNKINYPDAPGMIARHQKQGFKFITIADPHMKIENGYAPYDTGIAGDHFLKNPDGTYAEGNVWPGLSHFPDFSRPETRVWWGTLYKPLVDLGIDAIWNDMNEPAVFSTLKTLPLDTVHYDFGQNSSHEKMHNVYGLQMANGTVDGLDKLRPNNRNFVLSRAGYAGLQRYAAVWTGDNTANWTHLKLNVTMGLGMGLSGLPIVGSDVGGYAGRPTPELFARWMELGAFFPLYRDHTETGDYAQEPWAFGTEVENISRKYMEIRYKHLQMLYDFTHQAHKTGAPISRPLFMEFPADENTYDINDEFLYGDAMLIAPVVVEGAITRNVYLPVGVKWYDYWTGQAYEGGQSYQVQAKLDVLPIFVKAGAIIPSQEVMQYVGEKTTNPITLTVYPTGSYSYTLYLDDGTSKDYLTGKYREVTIAHTAEPNKRSLTFNVVTNGFTPTEKYYYVKLLQSDKPASVVVAGQTVRQANVTAMQASCDLSADVTAYCFNATEKTLVLKVMDSGKNFNIEVNGKAYNYLPVIKK